MNCRRTAAALIAAAGLTLATLVAAPAEAHRGHGHGHAPPTSYGTGGAVSSVDANASKIGRDVLAKGGNAADAAVAMAAALGVTEPYSAGVGGGGYFVYYDARTGDVSTIDGRETAPAGITPDAFIDPATGQPYPFSPDRVTSGVSVGVPGTLATWEAALDDYGTHSLRRALKPATQLASKGFVVDETFRSQTLQNEERFAAFPDTAALFLPDGDAPQVGTVFRNRDLAHTYRLIARRGTGVFYDGPIADEIADTVQDPVTSPDTDLPVPPGSMTPDDLAAYEVLRQAPTRVGYRGLDVYGMAPSSSGGTTVGEALNILENFDLEGGDETAQSLHYYIEASARAFADRGAYVGDPAFVDVPTETLLSQDFADARACTIDPDTATPRPVAAGALTDSGCATTAYTEKPDTENISTTHLSVVDKWGNAAAYTLTIEQTGGSGILVPGRGFLLNNELTDFSAVYDEADPNRIEPGKRPRSSMSPTIVLERDRKGGWGKGRGKGGWGKDKGKGRTETRVKYVLGSPGGSTIITTVLQILMNRIDLGMTLPEAVAAPRASQRNTVATTAEPEFIEEYGDALAPFGQALTPSGDQFTSAAEIGAAATIEVTKRGSMIAAAEPVRRGGGTGLVVRPYGR
ncbi:gamma-glutamyltranspeptidase/glutathione hydrolase [Mumia flava]|uniref:Glutathione hydrolase proenzyme n=1 Tax=Mumia flava TaxID=1348852 RepID=A0A0B2BA72_9ACTN|nr:gamma-glutamyltransferase [Mumia flava]PJJ58216.1 gamma-glutamyltranspeptidase/glutathione hydrolase [Mumia flava]